jgi:50S ribosomal protein L16 3-hydroxylase
MKHPLLRGIGTQTFLREYWQKQPLLLRQALPGFVSPLSPDELAGLALEPDIESRIVVERGKRERWELRNGPFDARMFSRLPPTRWTLLVQAVDHWVPAVQALRRHVDFLPPWRFDDIMVSYAVDKGGVGPHFDYYDVFLLQGMGRRHWRIGDRCDSATPLRSDTRLRILKKFVAREEFVLEPGDVLYVPPGVAHWGTAMGECMTYSIGFRAPSEAELLLEVASTVAAASGDDARYTDPPLSLRDADGEIPAAAVRRAQRALRELARDTDRIRDGFARIMTERKYPEIDIAPARSPQFRPDRQSMLVRNPASRFAWGKGGTGVLYVDGAVYPCDADLARLLSGARALDRAALAPFRRNKRATLLFRQLLAAGALHYGD